MRRKKNKQVGIRLGDTHFRMLEAICNVDGMSKTDVFEILICERFASKNSYRDEFYRLNGR